MGLFQSAFTVRNKVLRRRCLVLWVRLWRGWEECILKIAGLAVEEEDLGMPGYASFVGMEEGVSCKVG